MSEPSVKFYSHQHLPFILGSLESVGKYIIKQSQDQNLVVLPCDLHSLAALTNPGDALKKQLRQLDVLTTDGMPLVWWLKAKTHFKHAERVYGPDLMKYILKLTQHKNQSHYFYGSSPETLNKLRTQVLQLAPKTTIKGMISPPYRPLTTSEEKKFLTTIKKAAPTYLWLGIGSPQQIHLALKWKQLLPQTTIFCVGAAFDFIAQTKPSAPLFMKQHGLEWLFRVVTEPRRLSKRYLVTIPKFLLETALHKQYSNT